MFVCLYSCAQILSHAVRQYVQYVFIEISARIYFYFFDVSEKSCKRFATYFVDSIMPTKTRSLPSGLSLYGSARKTKWRICQPVSQSACNANPVSLNRPKKRRNPPSVERNPSDKVLLRFSQIHRLSNYY